MKTFILKIQMATGVAMIVAAFADMLISGYAQSHESFLLMTFVAFLSLYIGVALPGAILYRIIFEAVKAAKRMG